MKTLVPATIILMLVLISVRSAPVLAAGEPVIAPEVERLITEKSIEAAKVRYQELSQSDSLDLPLELQGFQTLMGAYLQAGKQDAAQAVGEMLSDMTMKMMSRSMNQYMPGLAEQMEAQQKEQQQAKARRQQEQQAEQRLQKERLDKARGKSRDDLLRFSGLYGEVGSDNMGRTIFVTVSCDGYLVTGPMWADIAPWWMHSASERVFTYTGSSIDFRMEFETDYAGKGVRIRHGIDGIKSPLEWKQALPEEWGKCTERPVY